MLNKKPRTKLLVDGGDPAETQPIKSLLGFVDRQYKDLDLNKPWESFDLRHELTIKGIQKFVSDFERTLQPSAHI